MYSCSQRSTLFPRRLALAVVLLALTACGIQPRIPSIPVPGPSELYAWVRGILSDENTALEFHQERLRLEELGPAIDTILIALVYDPVAKPVARANALILLGERRSPGALPTLRRALLSEEDELVRGAAVIGLQRLAPENREAYNAIRAAVGDPSRRVRLNALQALDIQDVRLIRELLAWDTDPQVRHIALQLLALAEARGAPLVPDTAGVYRTTTVAEGPRLVFRPLAGAARPGLVIGDLQVEVPGGEAIPLAQGVELVAGVVPAFFSPDRSAVVFEAGRTVRVRDLDRGETYFLGPGIAPRLLPFSEEFVFVREQARTRRDTEEGTWIDYEVVRADFRGNPPEPIGELRALAHPRVHGNHSPVRWMVVLDAPEGFALVGENLSTLLLPNPFSQPAAAPRDAQPGQSPVGSDRPPSP